jgi:4-hydroxy-3-methylbut-2-enyl diphosphate reductase
VETPEEVDSLPFSPADRLAYLTQTTLSVDEAGAVIDALKRRFPQIEHPKKEDICYATTNRQEAVKALIGRADLLLVLGSQNSSNSRRLMEIGLNCGIGSYLIDGVAEIQDQWFSGVETVVVTAGASAPEIVVQECIRLLEQKYGAEVQEVTLREEHVHFALPKELLQLGN